MEVPTSRRALVLAIVLAAALACGFAFAWMYGMRKSESIEDRARNKAVELQEKSREATQ